MAGRSQPRTDHAAPAHQRELGRLVERYGSFRDTTTASGVVVVLAPPGQWAEALLDDFKRHVVTRRGAFFEAACEGDSGRTYGPLRELLAHYAHHLEALGLLDPPLVAELSAVGALLGMGPLSGGASKGAEDVSLGRQSFFYERLAHLLQAFTRRSPAVLALRNLHLADSTTRAAVRFLVEHIALDAGNASAPDEIARERFHGLFVITSRDDTDQRRTMQGLALTRANVELMSLDGVDEEVVRRFLQDPDVIRRFVASSGGSPDNLRALVDDLPERVDEIFARRLARLEPDARQLLAVLAVYGRPVTAELVVRLSGVLAERFALLVPTLVDEHFVEQRINQGQFFLHLSGQHGRDLLYSLVDPALRCTLHARIARMLEEQQRYGHGVDIEEIAYHFVRSDDDEQAVRYALEAAERLHITMAYQRAAEFLEHVLPRLNDVARRRLVLERLIDLHCGLNEYRRALFYAGALKRVCGAEGRANVTHRTVRVLLEMGRYDLALKMLSSLRAPASSKEEQVRRQSLLAEALYGRGQHDEALAACESGKRTLGHSAEGALLRELINLRNTEAKIYMARRAFAQADEGFTRNIELAATHGWQEERVRALFNVGIVALLKDDYDRAESIFHDVLNFGHTTANPITRAFCLLNLAVIYHQTFRWQQALEYYLHSLATFKTAGNEFQFVATALNAAELYVDLGDRDRASSLVDAAGDVLERREIHHYRAWRWHLVGRLAMQDRAFETAREAFAKAEALAQQKAWAKIREVYVDRARLEFLSGQRDAFEHYLAAGLEFETPKTRAYAAWLRGSVARADGALAQAETELHDAATWFADNGLRHPLWKVRYEQAMVSYHQGRRPQAQQLLEEARALIGALAAAAPESMKARFTSTSDCLRVFAAVDSLARGNDPIDGKAGAGLGAPTPETNPDRAAYARRFPHIMGQDPRLQDVLRRVEVIAKSSSPVLVLGESGTGKELLANAIHRVSDRREGPLVKVNCGAFVETLLLSELFGHEKGAFTGAMSRKVGRFEMAEGGTLFLDEIGDVSANTQVALLRVLQEGTFERVGGTQTIQSDVRIVCATNRRLEELVKTGQFRLDLYYRLKGIVLELPPLRERPQDIPLLAQNFLATSSTGDIRKRFSRGAILRLLRYSWPGNVRELQNFVRSISLFVPGSIIEPWHLDPFEGFFSDGESRPVDPALERIAEESIASMLELEPDAKPTFPKRAPALSPQPSQEVALAKPAALAAADARGDAPTMVDSVISGSRGLAEMKKQLELECIRRALIESDGNVTRAAVMLQMKRPRLSQIINAHAELDSIKRKLQDTP